MMHQHQSLEPHDIETHRDEDDPLSDIEDDPTQMNRMEVVHEACATGDEESLDYPSQSLTRQLLQNRAQRSEEDHH